jgi:putative transposase
MEPTVYHAITRTSRGELLFGDVEKEMFRKMLWQVADFCGVEVLTYAVMSNHVHVVVRVPVKESLDALEPPEASKLKSLDSAVDKIAADKTATDKTAAGKAAVDKPAAAEAGVFISSGEASLARQGVPGADALVGNDEVLRRFGVLYGKEALAEATQNLSKATEEMWQKFRGQYVPLMHDLSWFMRLLKQRFARWFNAIHDTFGTLWAERFTSVIIEGSGDALLATCAYVDLNPVRAKLVSDPKDYRWCGYGEAVGGRDVARMGLARAVGEDRDAGMSRDELRWKFTQRKREVWQQVQKRYRLILFAVGSVSKQKHGTAQGKISAEEEAQVRAEGGELGWAVALRDRVRYFSRGGALGRQEFVERIFMLKRDRFPHGRKQGSHRMRGGDWGGLRSLRNLRLL